MTGKMNTVRRTATLSVAIALFASSIAAAQTPQAGSPTAASQTPLVGSAEFARMVQGRKVIITTIDGRQFDGTFTVSQTTVDAADIGLKVPFDRIARIEKPTYRMRILSLTGLAAGAGIGIIAYCASDQYCTEEPYWLVNGMVWGGIGAAAGGIIGAAMNRAHKNDDILYDVNRATKKTIALAPILSPTRKGVALSVTWR